MANGQRGWKRQPLDAVARRPFIQLAAVHIDVGNGIQQTLGIRVFRVAKYFRGNLLGRIHDPHAVTHFRPRLWVMSRWSAKFLLEFFERLERLNLASTITSREVVGSSAITSLARRPSAREIHRGGGDRRTWCGYL